MGARGPAARPAARKAGSIEATLSLPRRRCVQHGLLPREEAEEWVRKNKKAPAKSPSKRKLAGEEPLELLLVAVGC